MAVVAHGTNDPDVVAMAVKRLKDWITALFDQILPYPRVVAQRLAIVGGLRATRTKVVGAAHRARLRTSRRRSPYALL